MFYLQTDKLSPGVKSPLTRQIFISWCQLETISASSHHHIYIYHVFGPYKVCRSVQPFTICIYRTERVLRSFAIGVRFFCYPRFLCGQRALYIAITMNHNDDHMNFANHPIVVTTECEIKSYKSNRIESNRPKSITCFTRSKCNPKCRPPATGQQY